MAWLAGQRDRISHSAHHVEDLTVSATGTGWALSLLVRVEVMAAEGDPMVSLMRHCWQLRESCDRYAPITAMDIDVEHDPAGTGNVAVLAEAAGFHEGL